MLLATASEHVLTFLRPKLSGRAFHAGLHLKESLPSDVPIKTKRLVSELPKWHVLPDGSIAQPLAEWKSGINDSKTRGGTLSTEPSSRPRRGRKAMSNDVTEEGPKARKTRQKVDIEDKDAAPKPKRKKKSTSADEVKLPTKRRIVVEQSGEHDGQPRNVLSREIRENLDRFPHCLLLTRVGQFYESYFDQAIEISRLLNIKLTTRKWDGQRIAMCGFPLLHIDKYLKVMVQQHKRFVALCEEFPKYTSPGVKEFERRVSRVVTPGTLIDESFLNQYENNYLLTVSVPTPEVDNSVGLAWIDVSTGEFFSKDSTTDALRDEISRIGPREVVLPAALQSDPLHPVSLAVVEDGNFVAYTAVPEITPTSNPEDHQDIELRLEDGTLISHIPPTATPVVTDDIVVEPESAPTTIYSHRETLAINMLTAYLKANLLEQMPPLLLPHREEAAGRMHIDSHTIQGLEIRETMREGGTKGSLFSVIKKTITNGGNRLLARWLCSPSTSLTEINARQALVAFFHSRRSLREDLLAKLRAAEDASRIVQKLLVGRGDSSDLIAIKSTIATWSSLTDIISQERGLEAKERPDFDPNEWASLDALISRMSDLQELSQLIDSAVLPSLDSGVVHTEEEPSPIPSKFAIKPNFSAELEALHDDLRNLIKAKGNLEAHLQLQYDAPSLTLRSSPGLGMHIHLARAKRDQLQLNKVPTSFIPVAESNTTKTYFYQEWAALGGKIFEVSIALQLEEKAAFEVLRQEINANAVNLRRNARVLDELDVTLAFAELAAEMNFVRPTVVESPVYDVLNGRHPTVELGLITSGKVFTPNSVQMPATSRLHVVTGPNMAGKSTVLRQTALIAILAQIGSFVPAESATIGIVDRLFSRVGAKDDVFQNRSTFMVEMLETAEILRRATPRSLVIMDEVGRGTTVKDGLAIAFATLHHLVTVNQCRGLFATHFHELAEMLGYSHQGATGTGIFNSVAFYHTGVDETTDGHFSYAYRLTPGVNRSSHALKVAQLAGMPASAIQVARSTLELLEKEEPHR